ncbi:sulfur oxidation c-type cytochrome SoxX [Thalassovita taeanensis]|uniref:Monoheme cytochrome SoxX (Sulfur oxidation) n=1 Tax=Thalassovita taeanensis TaxID=657014 RepID=A0A1H9KRZ3_9RHOB|nr:sulfur oxidation c-type cytochrome SoxX [Thalassovita taeanensis]SER01697.1 monoheme cytochrome SoxX (sulfur oxidation) [Thalassovita taeanensis]
MRLSTLTLAATLAAGAAFANPVAPADVVFTEDGAVEQSLSGMAGNPEEGAKIMGSKQLGNCVACHSISALADVPFQGNVGPMLDGVADRWTAAELRGILSNAKLTYDGTVMPAYYKVDGFTRPGNAYTGKAADGPLDPLLSAQQIEDVIAFLGTLKE